jgi:hypothetical protein
MGVAPLNPSYKPGNVVIASEAKQSSGLAKIGLRRRRAPRNDEVNTIKIG